MEKRKRALILKDSLYLTISRFTRYGLMFIFTAICARYLGSNDYGIISYNLSQTSIIALLFSLGADTYIVVQLSKHVKKTNMFVSINMMNRIVLISTVTICIFIVNNITEIYPFSFVSIMIYFTTIFDSFRTISDGFFQSRQKIKYVAFFEILRAILLLIGSVFIIVFLKKGINGVAIIYFATSLFIMLVSYGLMIFKFNVKFVKVKLKNVLRLIREAFPFFLNGIILILSIQIDIIMINKLAGNNETAYYNTAKKIIDIVLMIPSIISMVILPRISKNQVSKVQSKKILRVITLIGIVVSIFIYSISDIFIKVAFGSEYIESSAIIKVFCLGFPLLFINSFISTCLIGNGLQKKVLSANAIGTTINIVSNLILIPKFLCVGAAISTLISIFINTIQFSLYYRKLEFVDNIKQT
ncbi:flippase [Clostridium zeae]|uniref:Flippase n=1 Tax=Clostridium zeae TaxID=2759022 RepID=A0ABQ1EGK7_9CLOT|nr:flippase [Clostridium zeae]GFZ33964.1 flippase [Clostridium zeae]